MKKDYQIIDRKDRRGRAASDHQIIDRQNRRVLAQFLSREGHKHVLGLRDGASENATVCTALLEDLVERGVKPDRCRLFVIDGSKALRKAIDAVYGQENPVPRCRNHKRKNVLLILALPKKHRRHAKH